MAKSGGWSSLSLSLFLSFAYTSSRLAAEATSEVHLQSSPSRDSFRDNADRWRSKRTRTPLFLFDRDYKYVHACLPPRRDVWKREFEKKKKNGKNISTLIFGQVEDSGELEHTAANEILNSGNARGRTCSRNFGSREVEQERRGRSIEVGSRSVVRSRPVNS